MIEQPLGSVRNYRSSRIGKKKGDPVRKICTGFFYENV